MSHEDIEATWYTNIDFQAMKKEANEVLRQRRKVGVSVCIRGLENKTVEGSRDRMLRRHRAMSSVFQEQKRQQRVACCYDPEAIAEAYSRWTKSSQQKAQEMAKKDYVEVMPTIEKLAPTNAELSVRAPLRSVITLPQVYRAA